MTHETAFLILSSMSVLWVVYALHLTAKRKEKSFLAYLVIYFGVLFPPLWIAYFYMKNRA